MADPIDVPKYLMCIFFTAMDYWRRHEIIVNFCTLPFGVMAAAICLPLSYTPDPVRFCLWFSIFLAWQVAACMLIATIVIDTPVYEKERPVLKKLLRDCDIAASKCATKRVYDSKMEEYVLEGYCPDGNCYRPYNIAYDRLAAKMLGSIRNVRRPY